MHENLKIGDIKYDLIRLSCKQFMLVSCINRGQNAGKKLKDKIHKIIKNKI